MSNELTHHPGVRRPNPAYVTWTFTATGAFTYTGVTDDGLQLIEDMARGGHALSSIAKALGINKSTLADLRKNIPGVQEAINAGRGGLQDELVSSLLKQAREGNTVAAIYLSKSICGLRDVGPATPDGSAGGAAININISAPMSDDQFARLITVEPPRDE